jgi:hypothetical protein
MRTGSHLQWRNASIHGRKRAIRDAFLEADRPLSPDEVLEGAQHHHPSLGSATVYRNIQSLVDEGWLQSVEIPGDSTRMKWPRKRITITSSAINAKSSMSWRDIFVHSNRSCRAAFGRPAMGLPLRALLSVRPLRHSLRFPNHFSPQINLPLPGGKLRLSLNYHFY